MAPGYQMAMWLVTLSDQKGQGHGVIMPGAEYLENDCRVTLGYDFKWP